jgi:hypothetical protein
MITVYLLLIWAGNHQGYISVPNLPSAAACEALNTEIQRPWIIGKSYRCILYEAVR